MPVPFSSDDLGRIFEARTITRGRTLVLTGAVTLDIEGDEIRGTVRDTGTDYHATLKPSTMGPRVIFASECTCGRRSCAHLAASALATLDKHPAWRKAQQQGFLANLLAAPAGPARKRLAFLLEPGMEGTAFHVSTVLEDERTLKADPTNPAKVVAAGADFSPEEHALCLALGGDATRTPVPGTESRHVGRLLDQLVGSGQARWKSTGRRLSAGPVRSFDVSRPPDLPAGSALLKAGATHWYIDAATGKVGIAAPKAAAPKAAAPKIAAPRMPAPTAPAPAPVVRRLEPVRPVGRGTTGSPGTGRSGARAAPPPAPRRVSGSVSDLVISEREMTPLLHLMRIEGPDEMGRIQQIDALRLAFDYEGALAELDDERQFVKVEEEGEDPVFVRRDRTAETKAQDLLRQDGFIQIRVQNGRDSKGRRIHVFRGRDAAERWQGFVAERLPQLQAEGWRTEIDEGFGPRLVDQIGDYDVSIGDAEGGWFSVELGIEVEGIRLPLLPILTRLLAQGGMEAAKIVDGMVHTSLDDGRVVALPADRLGRMLATMSDLLEASQRNEEGALLLPASEAATLLDLEDLLTTRWQNAAAIRSYVERFRDSLAIEPVAVPESFKATLRPYQEHGLSWLQHLRIHELAGILADDMGLGKTAQTIAHIVIEKDEGRLTAPAMIVVPTSLVANWSAELGKFAPHLRFTVHHGLDRHGRRDRLGEADVVITTYSVLTRDIDFMKGLDWHLVVLDEAQAIKSPESKTTRAVCALTPRHKLCLSGTPIENNLEELWSQFAFLMPGLLGDRRSFSKRFRTPIEKKADQTRQAQLVRRIRPFILRRTKAEVATELPPKHTIVRRISLAPEQRELYETIRVTLYDKVRHEIAEKSLARSRIVLLDALLKLRQVCCDPRLVKLPAAADVGVSSKLDDLMEMVTEMIAEGRRILLFSQFTSMLDLIKPALDAVSVPYVELRGDTVDRAKPVNAFEAGEVPLFLISLKAGGRGLNLTSADTVIHYDPWWNPAVEDQASDRAHRIGQTKSVFVYKLIAAGTVEERIVELQERKSALANIALGGDMELPGLELDDVDYLFGPDAEQAA